MPIFVVWGLIKRKDCKLAQLVNIYPDMHWSLVVVCLHGLRACYLDLHGRSISCKGFIGYIRYTFSTVYYCW